MVEDPTGDASGGILRHLHAHGCVAGFEVEADEPAAREPVDLQQAVVIPGPAVFAPVVRRLFAQVFRADTGRRESAGAVRRCR